VLLPPLDALDIDRRAVTGLQKSFMRLGVALWLGLTIGRHLTLTRHRNGREKVAIVNSPRCSTPLGDPEEASANLVERSPKDDVGRVELGVTQVSEAT
jgi:hypothetical protein